MSSNCRNLYNKLKESISHLSCQSWEEIPKARTALSSVIRSYDNEKEILRWLMSDSLSNKLIEEKSMNRGWYANSVKNSLEEDLILRVLDKSDDILKKSESNSIRMKIISEGYYSDIKLIDYVAKKADGELLTYCAQICSIRTLKKIKDPGNKSLMKIYYNRLGPVECLDDMIDDKYADNRTEGYRYAPFAYPKLNEKLGEIARGPSYYLIKKISKEYLPLLLGNRNIGKGSWIGRALQERMDREV